ncbi:MAG: EamA family transporter [Cyanobacteriota bacterium]|nr:EamA family transporter [Cyanobacteriota bacterium]
MSDSSSSSPAVDRSPLLALLALVFIWGYNWVVMKLGVQYASPLDYAALRSALGGIGLWLVLWIARKPLWPQVWLGTALTGFLQTTGFYGLTSLALASGEASKAAILNYAMPFWVLLLAWPMLGERLRRWQILAVVVALVGLVLILMPLRLGEDLQSKGLAFLSSLSWAAGIIVAKKLQQRQPLDVLSFTTWQMLLGSLPLVLLAWGIPSPTIEWSLPFWGVLLYSVIPSTMVAWLLWFYALSRLPAGMAGLGTLATPVVGVLAAAWQLGEQPTPLETLGMTFILLALLLNTVVILSPQR